MAREIALTPTMADAFVEAARNGVPPASIAAKLGIDDATVRRWLQVGRDGLTAWPGGDPIAPATMAALRAFYTRIRGAMAECEEEQLQIILDAAKTTGKSGVPEWRAAAWWLEKSPATRQTYHDHKEVTVEHRGEVGIEHRLVREMDDSRLLELAGPDVAGLLEPPR